jgi:acetyl-CoA/propionyl-CoA carboxylase biotin carboxyl carrier protein
VDSGLAPGLVVGSTYDPMVSKVIAYGPDRDTALRRLRAALAETVVLGVVTNAGYLRRLISHPDVVAGRLDTGLVERHPELTLVPTDDIGQTGAAQPVDNFPLLAAALLRQLSLAAAPAADGSGWTDPFAQPSGWRIGGTPAWTRHHLRLPGADPVLVLVRPRRGASSTASGATGRASGAFEVRIGDGDVLQAEARAQLTGGAGRLSVTLDGITHGFACGVEGAEHGDGTVWLSRDGDSWACHAHDPLAELALGGAGAHGGSLAAPMPGTVTLVKASVGDTVKRGQAVLVLEAMKMEHVITAPHDGTVAQLKVVPGATVAMDDLLAVIAPADDSTGQASES